MSRWLLLCLLWLGSASASAVELADLLDLPAERGPRALRSLLLDIAPAGNRLVAVGEYGTILYSDDKGASWKQAEVPVQVTLTAVFFPEPDLGWAVGLMLLQDAAMLAMDEALREQEIGPNRPFLDVWFSDKNMGYAIGAFNYFFVTEDGGKTWSDASFRLPNPEFLHLYSIASIDSSTLLLVGEFGMVMRSTDTGQTWEQLDLGYDGTLFAANGGEGEAWIGGLRGNVFHSVDAGDTWQRLERVSEASLLGSVVDGNGKARFAGLSGALLIVD
jgi:photosystem II stability/assembly factor-like uncharacterized protein